MNYHKLSQRQKLFARYTGLSLPDFNKLSEKLKPMWLEAEKKRLSRPSRQRKIGGGRKYKIESFNDKLLLILVFYKLYLTFDLLGFLFADTDKGCISRLIAKIEPILAKRLKLPEIKRDRNKPIASLDELFYLYPEMKGYIGDATEQEIPKPKDRQKNKVYRSGKKRRHTLKTQIIINQGNGVIQDVSPPFPGSVHDYKVFQKILKGKVWLKDKPSYWDKGYQGINKDFPKILAIIPKKSSRWHKLSQRDKLFNQQVGEIRIKVEHSICKCKQFKLLSQIYRHSFKDYHQRFKNIACLINFRIERAVIKQQEMFLYALGKPAGVIAQ